MCSWCCVYVEVVVFGLVLSFCWDCVLVICGWVGRVVVRLGLVFLVDFDFVGFG